MSVNKWVPVGPDFVFSPRDIGYKRLSRRNELGKQGEVQGLCVDPTDYGTIYTVEAPNSGGNSAFRTTDGGTSWTPIVDSLQQTDPAGVNPSCIALNPLVTGYVYLGTYSGRVYSSPGTNGSSWNPAFASAGSNLFKLIVDPRSASNPSTTIVYAAGSNGVWRSNDGAATFTQILSGNIADLAARFPTDGTQADIYAGVMNTGIFHAVDPSSTASWTNLTASTGSNLPAVSAFDGMRIDICRPTPRPYVWFFHAGATASLYTAPNSASAWSAISMTSPPQPAYPGWWLNQPEFPGLYDCLFKVAANSAGDGSQDILFFGSIGLSRSADSGKTWVSPGNDFHGDYHDMAFFPDPTPAGTIPFSYLASDGGICLSNGLADPTVTFPAPVTDYNDTELYNNASAVVQNLSHGKQSNAIYQYNSDPAIGALGYIGCQDTGIAAGDSAMMWRSIQDADGGAIAVTQGTNGVKVWNVINGAMYVHTDAGGFAPAVATVTLPGGIGVGGTSNFTVDAGSNCLGGVQGHFPSTTVASAISAGQSTVTPASMANIVAGSFLQVDNGKSSAETVTVISVTSTTFTAVFVNQHDAGATIGILYNVFARVDQSAKAVAVSATFQSTVSTVAASPNNADIAAFGTSDQRLFLTQNATAATPTWTEITASKPTGLQISSIALDGGNNVFVLLGASVTTGGGEFTTTSPLFRIVADTWEQIACTNLPGPGGYAKLLADPVQSNVMYAGNNARVFKLTADELGATTEWTDISNGLPGQWIYDLWVGNIGNPKNAKVLLRAAVPTRGVWELDVTAGSADQSLALYLRDNFLDMGRLPKSPDGVPNPYNPSDRGSTLYHYQCADIKVDGQQQDVVNGAVITFFQTDPEGGQVLSHVLFDQLVDNSDHLNSANQAKVHVQVHNRGLSIANAVWVWAIYANAGAGLPALNATVSNSNFNFWKQFSISGISPALPNDSIWKSVGLPIRLDGIDAAHPQVASWNWTVPTLGSGDLGHYCIAAFVQSAASQIKQTDMDLDNITPIDKQIGQKNLHIGPPLPSIGGGSGGGGGAPGSGRPMLEYIEFHNSSSVSRTATLVLDLRGLPSELVVSFMLTPVVTVNPLPGSISGVVSTSGKPGTIGPSCGHKKHCHHHHGCHDHDGDGDGDHKHHCRCESLDMTSCASCQLPKCSSCHGKHLPKTCPCKTFFNQFKPIVYTASPSALVSISGVKIPASGFVAAYFSVVNTGTLPEGLQYRFNVQQLVNGLLVGGSTYVVRIAGKAPYDPFEIPDEDEFKIQPMLPPWIEKRQKR